MIEGSQYELVHSGAWDLFVQWYGMAPTSPPALARKVIGPAMAPTV